MQQVRRYGTTGPNNRVGTACYWFDAETSPMLSEGVLGNQSTTLMVEASTRATVSRNTSAARRIAGRVGWLLTYRLLPAAALSGLVLWQLMALVSELQQLNVHPGWVVLGECVRSALYVLFLCFPVAAFLTHEPPRSRDGRVLVTCAAIAASFLLAGVGLLVPGGPQLWRPSPELVSTALALTLAGVALAVVSAQALGGSFSFGPQGRALIVRGPYRLVRHPIYLAEIAMIVGVMVVNPRLVPLAGACAVIVLQLVRIRAEERLLRSTFPGFSSYAAVTRYRLVPFLW